MPLGTLERSIMAALWDRPDGMLAQDGADMANIELSHGKLAGPMWVDLLTSDDRKGLTLLFWQHVCSYGEVRLYLGPRLSIGGVQ